MKHVLVGLMMVQGTALAAQDAGPVTLAFKLGAGVQSGPGYFGGSEDIGSITGTFEFDEANLFGYSFGGGDPNGFGLKAGFRIIGERSASEFEELTGLDDVDAAVEIGGGFSYTQQPDGRSSYWGSYSFAEVRYGVVGHEAYVASLGADLIYQPTPQLELRAGPRLFAGDDDYAATYFGVTGAEAVASTGRFDAFEATGGVLSRGLEMSASYDVTADWGIVGTVTYEEFLNDAAGSPIVQQGSADQLNVSLIVTRAFQF